MRYPPGDLALDLFVCPGWIFCSDDPFHHPDCRSKHAPTDLQTLCLGLCGQYLSHFAIDNFHWQTCLHDYVQIAFEADFLLRDLILVELRQERRVSNGEKYFFCAKAAY
jgi:hypothetical protein